MFFKDRKAWPSIPIIMFFTGLRHSPPTLASSLSSPFDDHGLHHLEQWSGGFNRKKLLPPRTIKEAFRPHLKRTNFNIQKEMSASVKPDQVPLLSSFVVEDTIDRKKTKPKKKIMNIFKRIKKSRYHLKFSFGRKKFSRSSQWVEMHLSNLVYSCWNFVNKNCSCECFVHPRWTFDNLSCANLFN